MRFTVAVLTLVVSLVIPIATQTVPLRLIATIALPNVAGRIDHAAFDPATQRLFVAALGNDTVEVVDTATSTHLRSLTGFHEPQGLAVAPDITGVAIANGDSGTLQLLDTQSLAVRWTAQIGGDADNVRYDPARKRFMVAALGGLFAVDPSNGAVTNRIAFMGHPESFQLETKGSRIYANLPGASKIIATDRATWAVVAPWDAGTCGANYPMVLDEAASRLFIGCRRPASVAVFDTSSGRPVRSFETVGDTDDMFLDSERSRLYVIGGEGAIDVFTREGDALRPLARVATRSGARTGLWVASQSRLYVAVPARDGAGAEVRVFSAQ